MRYNRLNTELVIAQLVVQSNERAARDGKPLCPDLTKLSTKAYLDSCDRRMLDNRIKRDLAERELNRFMR